MMFGKTYSLNLSRNYVRHWGVAQGIRELIQNALDSDSPFVYEIDREDDGAWTLSLLSEHSTLSASTLLLGATSKAEATDKIGSFGEGYKIAMLVLVREGLKLVIWNGDKHWTPYFQYNRMYDDDVLCVEEVSMPHRNRGLRFLVSGLTAEQVEEVRASCLQMQDDIGMIQRTPKGDILFDRPGKLYVGGLYICDTEMTHGYDIKPEFIRLERDRQTVDSWDLSCVTRDIWVDTGRADDIARMLDEGVKDVEYAKYSSPMLVKEACYRLFREKHPGAVVADSNEELQKLVKQGMTAYVVGYAGLVRESDSYRAEVRASAPPTPTERLSAWWRKAQYHIHHDHKATFDALLRESTNWRMK
jgi:hypothetical protein